MSVYCRPVVCEGDGEGDTSPVMFVKVRIIIGIVIYTYIQHLLCIV